MLEPEIKVVKPDGENVKLLTPISLVDVSEAMELDDPGTLLVVWKPLSDELNDADEEDPAGLPDDARGGELPGGATILAPPNAVVRTASDNKPFHIDGIANTRQPRQCYTTVGCRTHLHCFNIGACCAHSEVSA